MTRDFVVDASVAIKLFVVESDSPIVHRFFTRSVETPPTRFYVPDLFFVECTNILWKYTRRYNYPVQNAQQDVVTLRALDFRVISTTDLIVPALSLALKFDITAYDAVYVALAQKLNIPLVTADERLGRKLETADVKILGVSET